MTSPKNILIVRTDRIGDVVLTLPLAAIIKKHYTDSKITYLLNEYTKPLAENNHFIDKVITLLNCSGKYKILANAKYLKNQFDTAIIAFPSFRIALILFLAGIKIRIGTGYRWYSFLFNRKIYDHRKTAEYHELEYNVRLLKKIGIEEKVSFANVIFGLSVTSSVDDEVNKKLKNIGITNDDKFIILHPGSGGSALDLPFESMKKLSTELSLMNKFKILITGNEKEKKLCQSLVVNKNTINAASLFSLSEMISVINKSYLLIANSTGPIHIAAALSKQVIGFYPKVITCSEERWGPYTNNKVIFKPDERCSGHTIQQCKEQNCMASIKVEEVVKSVVMLIN